MARTRRPQIQEDLLKHLNQSKVHPISMAAYCREVGIPVKSLYSIQERLSKLEDSSPKARPKKTFAPRIKSSGFVQVAVEPAALHAPTNPTPALEAKWVAEVIYHLQTLQARGVAR